MIHDLLERLILAMDGCQAVLITGKDGVAVDWIVVDNVVEPELLAAAGSEVFTRGVRLMAEAMGREPQEIDLWAADGSCCMIQPVGPSHDLMLLLRSGADLGGARCLARSTAQAMIADLGPDPGVWDARVNDSMFSG